MRQLIARATKRKLRSKSNHRLNSGFLLYEGTYYSIAQHINRVLGLNLSGDIPSDMEALELYAQKYRMEYDVWHLTPDRPRTPFVKGNVEAYRLVANALAFIAKYEGHSAKTASYYNPEHSARETYDQSEAACLRTNARVRNIFEHPNGDDDAELRRLVFRVRSMMISILGEKPDIETILRSCKFTGGASIGVHGDRTHFVAKATADWTATPGVRGFIRPMLSACGLAREGDQVCDLDLPSSDELTAKVRFVGGNKLSFVPKTVATHRAIAVEPLLNGLLQSGIDAELRKKLLAIGIDLQHGQAYHNRLAYEGSISSSYATIDLRSASDTMSRLLIKAVLPYEWYVLLDCARSPRTGDRVLEKFCSMGNNFCFPLQTLLFYCIAISSGAEFCSVYGDDIVVDDQSGETVCNALRCCGFTPNPNKTFYGLQGAGRFRESCGTDWYNGESVRPAYAKKPWDSLLNVASFHNIALERWPSEMHYILHDIRKKLGPRALVRPSKGSDGNAFNVALDEAMVSKTVRWNRSYQTWEWLEFRVAPKLDRSTREHNGTWLTRKAALFGYLNAEEGLPYRRKARTRCAYTCGADYEGKFALMPALRTMYKHGT